MPDVVAVIGSFLIGFFACAGFWLLFGATTLDRKSKGWLSVVVLVMGLLTFFTSFAVLEGKYSEGAFLLGLVCGMGAAAVAAEKTARK